MRQGRFELADGGTIFLDEIGDLPPDIQVKFLRVLQEGEFERVGSSRTKAVDVRVIAATHHDLEAAVAEGRFRADLYYRLSVYPIQLPSLRERVDDIPRLVWFFIHRHQRELGRHITKVPQSVMDALQQLRVARQRARARERRRARDDRVDRRHAATRRAAAFNAPGPIQARVPDNLDAVQRAAHRGGPAAVRLADQRTRKCRRTPRRPSQYPAVPDEEAGGPRPERPEGADGPDRHWRSGLSATGVSAGARGGTLRRARDPSSLS